VDECCEIPATLTLEFAPVEPITLYDDWDEATGSHAIGVNDRPPVLLGQKACEKLVAWIHEGRRRTADEFDAKLRSLAGQ
jgi:hypothetical protein